MMNLNALRCFILVLPSLLSPISLTRVNSNGEKKRTTFSFEVSGCSDVIVRGGGETKKTHDQRRNRLSVASLEAGSASIGKAGEERNLRASDPETVAIKVHPQAVQTDIAYNKTCMFEYLAAPEGLGSFYNVSLFYHIGMLNNWREIVLDQFDTLERCGLGYIASNLTISFYNPSTDVSDLESVHQIMELLHQFQFTTYLPSNATILSASNSFPWERPIMEHISNFCHQMKTSHIVFYFHTKGSSKYSTAEPESEEYLNVFAWRKYMEWFLLERPTLCMRAILRHGAETCGVEMYDAPSMHYSGNFWSASCDHISDLPVREAWPMSETNEWVNYVSAEMWIGNYRFRSTCEEKKYLNLFHSHFRLYEYRMTPDKYSWMLHNPKPIQQNPYTNNHYEGSFIGDHSELWLDYTFGLKGILQ